MRRTAMLVMALMGLECAYAVAQPPGDATGFLAPYINPKREALPAHRIFPLGQKMMLSAWNPGNVDNVNMLHENGFTAVGPFENGWPSSNKSLLDVITRARTLGMRAWLRMGGNYGLVHKVCDGWKAGKTDEDMIKPMVKLWERHYSKSPYNDITDAFLMMPEEMSSRLDTGSKDKYKKKYSESDILRFNDKIINTIKKLDKANPPRPIIRTEVEGNVYSNIQKTAGRVATPHAQHYIERVGWTNFYKHMAAVQTANAGYLKYATRLASEHPISEERYPGLLPGMIFEPLDQSEAWSKKYAHYYIWTSVAQGIKGFSLYRLNSHVAKGRLKRAFIAAIKELTDHGFDQAFLWGTANPARKLTFAQTAGPRDASWPQGDRSLTAVSMLAAQRQFGNKRYIVITNSHWDQSIVVKISGLPTGKYMIRDCKTNATFPLTRSVNSITLAPNGYAIYTIEHRS